MTVKPLLSPVYAGLLSLLAACGETRLPNAAAESASRELRPTGEALAAIYDRSCRSCHTVAATGAPLTGDHPAWAERMDKGLDVLVENVVNGYGGMPPYGLCMDCSVQQFEDLVLFMAGRTR